LAVALLITTTLAAQGHGTQSHFAPLTSFGVSGVAEIVDASPDGRTLVYTNATAGNVGIVDISDPAHPTSLAEVTMPGQPTSVSIIGHLALVTVWADPRVPGNPTPAFLPGQLVVLDIANPAAPAIVGSVPLGWHPDSVKATVIGGHVVAVVAIENEPVIVSGGIVEDEDAPGNPNDVGPAGLIQVVILDTMNPMASTVADVTLDMGTLAAAGLTYPSDPQPEFVTIHGTTAAVSLQENNGIAIVDIATPSTPILVRVFSLGTASNRVADLVEDDAIAFIDVYPAAIGVTIPLPTDGGGNPVPGGLRFPDSIAFSPDGSSIISADEGELNLTGGRGFSAWSPNGNLLFEERELERAALLQSHYPDGRSENRGIEVEGVATGVFGGRSYAFLLSERGSFMAVYLFSPLGLVRTQILPTGISPEGIVAIPSRDLVVTADEVSGTLTLFQRRPGPWLPPVEHPVLLGTSVANPFAALSGLCPDGPDAVFSVPDNALPTSIFRIQVGAPFAPVDLHRPVLRMGVQTRYDGEGIVVDTSIAAPANPGWWIASEGDTGNNPNLLVQVDGHGDVVREIQLPAAIDPAANAGLPGFAQPATGNQTIRSNGFEGVTLSADGRYLLACIQRDFAGEFPSSGPRYARIARYDLQQVSDPSLSSGLRTGGDWEFFFYPLDATAFGLSEITRVGTDQYAIIERDQGIGVETLLRKIYVVDLTGVSPDADGVPDTSDTLAKVEALDVLRAFFPYEKVEGLALMPNGDLWVGLDNDGGEVESRLINTGTFQNPLEVPVYPGSDEDVALDVSVDGTVAANGFAIITAGSEIAISLYSPGLTQVGAIPVILAQPFATGSVPMTAGLANVYLDFFGTPAPIVLFDGTVPPFGPAGLSVSGLTIGPFLLSGLPAGTSVMVQGGVFDTSAANGSVAVSNGVEIRSL
jgi:hypothetical protein